MRTTFIKTVVDISLHPRNFTKFASVVMMASGLIGIGIMKAVEKKRGSSMKEMDLLDVNDSAVVQDVSLVQAMIDNAKTSTTRENLEIAFMAQNNFVIPQHPGEKEKIYIARLKEKSVRKTV